MPCAAQRDGRRQAADAAADDQDSVHVGHGYGELAAFLHLIRRLPHGREGLHHRVGHADVAQDRHAAGLGRPAPRLPVRVEQAPPARVDLDPQAARLAHVQVGDLVDAVDAGPELDRRVGADEHVRGALDVGRWSSRKATWLTRPVGLEHLGHHAQLVRRADASSWCRTRRTRPPPWATIESVRRHAQVVAVEGDLGRHVRRRDRHVVEVARGDRRARCSAAGGRGRRSRAPAAPASARPPRRPRGSARRDRGSGNDGPCPTLSSWRPSPAPVGVDPLRRSCRRRRARAVRQPMCPSPGSGPSVTTRLRVEELAPAAQVDRLAVARRLLEAEHVDGPGARTRRASG